MSYVYWFNEIQKSNTEENQKAVAKDFLQDETDVTVRFNEADPLGIVWHGHYLRYFEDGREAFGRKFGVSYMDFYHQGFAVPIISVHCNYKKPLRFGEVVTVQTKFVNAPAAKIRFEYKIFKKGKPTIVAEGHTLQVFVDVKSFDLQLITPAFFESWKKKWELE